MTRRKSALTCRERFQRRPWTESLGKRASASPSEKWDFLASATPSVSRQSQNLPSTVADEDFFRGKLRVDACAPGIRREGSANLPIGITGLIGIGELTLDHFQFVPFDGDGHGALDGFNGDHQVLFPTLFQNPFQTIQAAASNSYFLSDLHEKVESAWDLLGQ